MLLPILPIRLPPSAYQVGREQVAQSKRIQALIETKQWDQALQEFQQGSEWVQDQTIRPLFVALVQSNQTTYAVQFVIEKFPPQSKYRAQGIGEIAAELTTRNQFPDAIALLKQVPQNSDYLSDAIVPIVGALTAMNQIKNIPQVMSLFPVSNEQWTVWTTIGKQVPFEPAQAKEVAGMIEGEYLRSLTLKNMTNYWLPASRRNVLKAWNIANEIEDCSTRVEVLLETFAAMKASSITVSSTQQAQALDQLEILITKLQNPNLNYQSDSIDFQLSLASLNIQSGRKAQGMKLIGQVQQALKQFDSPIYRAETLLKLATQHQSIGNNRIAVQMLDAAVTETHTANKPKPWLGDIRETPALVPDRSWTESMLKKIVERYRSLNQHQKADAIERTLPQQPSFMTPVPRTLFPTGVLRSRLKPIPPGQVPF